MKNFIRYPLLLVLLFLTICVTATAKGAVIDDDASLNTGDVLIGPCGVPGAMGPTGVNDDFTNLSLHTGIANVPPGGFTTAAGVAVFRNTIQNTGAGNDVFFVSASAAPAGFNIEISTDSGDSYVTLGPTNPNVPLLVAYRAAAVIMVRISAPAGLPVLNGFDTVIRATSKATPGASNETIERLYTGFVRLDKSTIVPNAVGGGTAGVSPGAEVEFVITYSNVSSSAGVGNSLLTARNLIISEDGKSGPNNWGETTAHIVGATDTHGGYIIGDRDGSTSLTDLVSSLAAGQSGTFKFKRRVK
jgi:hypothetical protein